MLTRVTRDFAPRAITVTENGAAFADPPTVNGLIADPRRGLPAHAPAFRGPRDRPVPVRSLLFRVVADGQLEWAEGYAKRFEPSCGGFRVAATHGEAQCAFLPRRGGAHAVHGRALQIFLGFPADPIRRAVTGARRLRTLCWPRSSCSPLPRCRAASRPTPEPRRPRAHPCRERRHGFNASQVDGT